MDVSFYGGRQGAPFVIYKHFSTYDDMNTELPNDETPYGAYVLVNTIGKNLRDSNHGDLYQKGLDGQPKYIGNISGPTGYSPRVGIASYNDEAIFGKSNSDLYYYTTSALAINNGLIPGFSSDGEQYTYNDDINLKMASIRNYAPLNQKGNAIVKTEKGTYLANPTTLEPCVVKEDGQPVYVVDMQDSDIEKYGDDIPHTTTEETTVHVGLQIPYPVLTFDARSSSPYDASGELLGNINLIKEVMDEPGSKQKDEKTHPFAAKWKISVPKGIKGDSLDSFDLTHDDKGNSIIIANIINYDSKKNGEITSKEVGYLKDIREMEVADNYHLMVTYSGETEPQDLGPIHRDVGLKTGPFFNLGVAADREFLGISETAEQEAIINALNSKYPDGKVPIPYNAVNSETTATGYIVCVQKGETQFLYSYFNKPTAQNQPNSWQLIGTVSGSTFEITSIPSTTASANKLLFIKYNAPSLIAANKWPNWSSATVATLDLEFDDLATVSKEEYEEE